MNLKCLSKTRSSCLRKHYQNCIKILMLTKRHLFSYSRHVNETFSMDLMMNRWVWNFDDLKKSFSKDLQLFWIESKAWIENFKRMGHFCCFQHHFFQLSKAKLGKYKKVEEKWLFIPFPLIFCYNLAKN